MFIKTWEKIKGKATHYINLYHDEIEVGRHYGNGHTDDANRIKIGKFSEGEFQDLILKVFGEEVLTELLNLIMQLPGRDKKLYENPEQH